MNIAAHCKFFQLDPLVLLLAEKGIPNLAKVKFSIDRKAVGKPYFAVQFSSGKVLLAALAGDAVSTGAPTLTLTDHRNALLVESRGKALPALDLDTLNLDTDDDYQRLWKTLLVQVPKSYVNLSKTTLDVLATRLASPQSELIYLRDSLEFFISAEWGCGTEGATQVRLQPIGTASEADPRLAVAFVTGKRLFVLGRMAESEEQPLAWLVTAVEGSGASLVTRGSASPSDWSALRAALANDGKRNALAFLEQQFGADRGSLASPATTEPAVGPRATAVRTTAALTAPNTDCPWFGRLESVENGRAMGWALSKASPNFPVRLEFLLDERVFGEVVTSRKVESTDEADVFERHAERAGFSVDLKAWVTPAIRAALHGRDSALLDVRIHGTAVRLLGGPVVVRADDLLALPAPLSVPENTTVTKNYRGQIEAVRGRSIVGWIADFTDPNRSLDLEFYLDGAFVGTASASHHREELRSFTPDNPRHGFEFVIPQQYFLKPAGQTRYRLEIRDRVTRKLVFDRLMIDGIPKPKATALNSIRQKLDQVHKLLESIYQEVPYLRCQTSYHIDEYDEYFREHYQLSDGYRKEIEDTIAGFSYCPTVSIVMPTYKPNLQYLDEAIRSIEAQLYRNWELILVDDGSKDDAIESLMSRYVDFGSRIKFRALPENQGVSKATNEGVRIASGEYIALMDHDDILTEDALFEVVKALQSTRYRVIYTDEDRLSNDGQYLAPMFKPDFNYDLLLAYNYICHFLVVNADAFREVGGLDPNYDGCQDHELLLRLSERVGRQQFHHIARVVYHWRVNEGSISQSAASRDALCQKIAQAVQTHLDRMQSGALVSPDAELIQKAGIFANRVFWPLPGAKPLVSIVVPTKDSMDLVAGCLHSLLNTTDYERYEIILVDHASQEQISKDYLGDLQQQHPVNVLKYEGIFNWSSINNYAARRANGEILVFLNNDTVVLSRNWLSELISHLARPNIGAVGAKLLYSDGTVQHAGVYLGIGGVAGHAFTGLPANDPGYLGRAALSAEVSAVTGACLATRKEIFEAVGGFDEIKFAVAFNDVDYCLKLLSKGFGIIWTPHALLYHLESKSRGGDNTREKVDRLTSEIDLMQERWGEILDLDRYYNPHFEKHNPILFGHITGLQQS